MAAARKQTLRILRILRISQCLSANSVARQRMTHRERLHPFSQ